MRRSTVWVAMLGVLLLLRPYCSLAAAGDERFVGGYFSGYAAQLLMQESDAHAACGAFAGGSHDGYGSQVLVQESDAHAASGAFAGGAFDGYGSQVLVLEADAHAASGAFAGGVYDGYASQVLIQEAGVHASSGAFAGGVYDGYASQVLVQETGAHASSGAFAGGGYDGYSSQVLVQDADAHSVSAVYAGGGFDGYGSQVLIQPLDTHEMSSIFSGGNQDGYGVCQVLVHGLDATAINGRITGDANGWYAPGATVTVYAVAAVPGHFGGWIGDTQGDTNVLTMNVTLDRTRVLTALFVSAQFTLTVVSEHGQAAPAGAVTNDYGTRLTCRLPDSPVTFGGTQYLCTGWAITGIEPAMGVGTNVTFDLTNNAVLTWQWQTNHWLAVSTVGNGTCDRGAGWVAAYDRVAVTATPAEYWHFEQWNGDTNQCLVVSNRVELFAMSARAIEAQFGVNRTVYGTPEDWLARHGITNDAADIDGDGMYTWAEYVAGTDPTNRTSTLVFTNVQNEAGTQLVLHWNSVTGRLYTVEHCLDLRSEDFVPLASNLPATSPLNVYTSDAVLLRGNFRIQVQR